MRTKIVFACFALVLLAGCVARTSQPEQPAPTGGVCDVRLTRYQPPPAPKTPLEKVLPEGTKAGPALNLAGVELVAINQPGAPADTNYLTLDEAIAKNVCTVRETGTVTRDAQGNEQVTDGDVNRLLVSNTSNKPIFLMAGDLVLGGKQDRILAAGLVVEPGTKELGVQVFCVEHGRWTPRAGEAQSAAGLFVNSATVGQADINVKKAAVGSNDQSQVWQAVATNNSNLGVSGLSAGGSFRATYDSEEIQKNLETLMKEAAPLRQAGPVGYAVLVDGDVAVMDLFDSTALCGKLSEKLLRSYLITALSGGYNKAPDHPLTPRLQDKVTAKFEKIKLSDAIAALDEAWDATLDFKAGDKDPVITYSANDQPMAAVIDSFGAFYNVWATVTEPNTIALQAGVAFEDIQFTQTATGGIASANPSAGIFFNDQSPAQRPVNFNQDIRGGFEHIFANASGNIVLASLSSGTASPRAVGHRGAPVAASPIEYDCKDAKRESTVHRGYMRR